MAAGVSCSGGGGCPAFLASGVSLSIITLIPSHAEFCQSALHGNLSQNLWFSIPHVACTYLCCVHTIYPSNTCHTHTLCVSLVCAYYNVFVYMPNLCICVVMAVAVARVVMRDGVTVRL